jgi:hypothetical protein
MNVGFFNFILKTSCSNYYNFYKNKSEKIKIQKHIYFRFKILVFI